LLLLFVLNLLTLSTYNVMDLNSNPLLVTTATLASFAFALQKPKAKVAHRAKGSRQQGAWSLEHGAMEHGAGSMEQGAGWAIYSPASTLHPAACSQHPAPSSCRRQAKAKGAHCFFATFAFGYATFAFGVSFACDYCTRRARLKAKGNAKAKGKRQRQKSPNRGWWLAPPLEGGPGQQPTAGNLCFWLQRATSAAEGKRGAAQNQPLLLAIVSIGKKAKNQGRTAKATFACGYCYLCFWLQPAAGS
jgi:hypothetical protein